MEALASDGLALEVLIVDDCSTDGSLSVAETLAAASPSVRVLRHPQSRMLWVLSGLSACSLSRGLLAWHGAVTFVGETFPLSDVAFRCWDSLNSTLSLCLAAALCVWLWRGGRSAT